MADDAGGRFSRRKALGAGAGAAGALALGLPNLGCGSDAQGTNGTNAATDTAPTAPDDAAALIPRDRRGIQLYTVRDAIGRAPGDYPTLPTGFRQVFEALAESGYATVEGFNDEGVPFRQHPDSEGGAEPSPRLIKRWLDEYGMKAGGHYGRINPGTIDATLRLAETLDTPIIGSVDPIATALRYGDRVTFFHAKDGVRSAKPPQGFEGNWVWTVFNTGYMAVEELFQKVMATRGPADAPYINIEQDNAVAGEGHSLAEPISDPTKSLRDAHADLAGLVAMRG